MLFTLVNYPVNMLPAKVALSAYSQASTVKHIGLPFHKNSSDLLGRSLSLAGRNRLAGSGRPGPARASRISWDRAGSDWVGPAVSRGLVVKVTREF